MCVASLPGRRNRTLTVVANLCLILALCSQVFHLSFGLRQGPLEFARGLCFGLYITLQLRILWRARRQRQQP